MQHCATVSEPCVVSTHYQDYQEPYAAAHLTQPVVTTATPGDFTPMYVNTVWGPQDTPAQPTPQGMYYEAYPGAAAAMYGYPTGHPMIGHDGTTAYHTAGLPQHPQQQQPEGGKRKRRRVISYEQRKAANVRERKRMCHLNDAFDVLRKRVPTFAYEKKLSRIETLKLAVTYIQYMAELLDDIEDKKGSKSCDESMSSKSESYIPNTPSSSASSSEEDRSSQVSPVNELKVESNKQF